MCALMLQTKMVMTRNTELEEELRTTCDGYEEEIATLLEKNEDLKKKLETLMGDPEPEENISLVDYILIDDTDSDDDSSDDYEDEAGADIMESSSEEYF